MPSAFGLRASSGASRTPVVTGSGADDANRALQRAIMPRSAPTTDGFDLAAGTMLEDSGAGRTAWETVRFADGRAGLVAMTVHGDGLPPAHQLALARAFLNEFARTGQSAESLFASVNDGLSHNETPGVDQTVAAGMLVPGDGSVLWSGAGDVRGAVIRRDGTLDEFPSHGPPLGMLDGFQYGTQEYEIGTGDMVIVLSTGSSRPVQGGGRPGLHPAAEARRRGRGDRAQSHPEAPGRGRQGDYGPIHEEALTYGCHRERHPKRAEDGQGPRAGSRPRRPGARLRHRGR